MFINISEHECIEIEKHGLQLVIPPENRPSEHCLWINGFGIGEFSKSTIKRLHKIINRIIIEINLELIINDSVCPYEVR